MPEMFVVKKTVYCNLIGPLTTYFFEQYIFKIQYKITYIHIAHKYIYISIYIDVSVSASSLLFVCPDALQQLAPCIFRNPIDIDIRCPFGDQIHPEARKFYENAGGKNINGFLENTACTGFFLRQVEASSCKF